jgi:hypothetical protein
LEKSLRFSHQAGLQLTCIWVGRESGTESADGEQQVVRDGFAMDLSSQRSRVEKAMRSIVYFVEVVINKLNGGTFGQAEGFVIRRSADTNNVLFTTPPNDGLLRN